MFLNVFGYPETISSDGRMFIYHNAANLSMVALLGTNNPPRPLWDSKSQLYNAELSPDGRWVAYQSNESGRFEIYVHPFPDLKAGRWQVTFAGGAYPGWTGNGRELAFIAGDGRMNVLPVQTTPSFASGNATPLFATSDFFLGIARTYDLSPSGDRFVMLRVGREAEVAANREVVVTSNWLGQLRPR